MRNRKPRWLYQTSERQVLCPRCGEWDWETSVARGGDLGCARAEAEARTAEASIPVRADDWVEQAWEDEETERRLDWEIATFAADFNSDDL